MSISLAKRFCLGAAAMTLAYISCSAVYAADWPMFRHDMSHTGSTAESVSPPLRQVWSSKLGDRIVSSPAIVNGVVYVGTREKIHDAGALNALNARTGKLLWKYVGTKSDPIRWVDSSPAVSNGVVYFTSRDGHLNAITTSGKLKWRFKSGGTETSSPVVTNGIVCFGSAFPNKEVFAVDASTGKLRWKFATGQMVYSSPAASNGVIYIGSDDGRYYALDAATGKQKWSHVTSGGIYYNSPTLGNGILLAVPGDYDPGIYGLNTSTGKVEWKLESGASNNYVSTGAYRDGIFYVGSCMPSQELFAIEASNGRLKWKTSIGATTSQMFTSSPAISGNTLYVGTGAFKSQGEGGRLLALDLASGKTKWEFNTPDPVISSPAVSNGMVVFGTLGGTLYGFSGSSAKASGARSGAHRVRSARSH